MHTAIARQGASRENAHAYLAAAMISRPQNNIILRLLVRTAGKNLQLVRRVSNAHSHLKTFSFETPARVGQSLYSHAWHLPPARFPWDVIGITPYTSSCSDNNVTFSSKNTAY